MSTLAVSTGIIYHSAQDSTTSYEVHPDLKISESTKVIKFCYGFDHLVLLKENGVIQPIASKDSMSGFFKDGYTHLQNLNLPIIDIAFGKEHALALTSKNEMIAFGDNSFGQLGVGSISDKSTPLPPAYLTYFSKVNQKIIAIKCGAYHSVALSKSGDIYTWGKGKNGQLGTKNLSIQILPRYVYLPLNNKNDKIEQIQCGPESTAAITKQGVLYQWGDGKILPAQISLDDGQIKVKKIAIGISHTLCLTESNKLYGYGQQFVPLELKNFAEYEICDIECCGLYTVICTRSNGLFVLGYNDCLFNKMKHINPFKIDLTSERIVAFGCARYDFAVLTATKISNITPSISYFAGSEIKISGHAFYPTAFEPTVKFVLNDSIVFIENAQKKYKNDEMVLCVSTPNWKSEGTLSSAVSMKVSVAMDGKYYSEPIEIALIEAPDANIFDMSPKCGDVDGNIECLIESADYISKLSGLQLKDIKIRMKHDEQVHVIDAFVNKLEKIQFVMPVLQEKGEYTVYIAMDGKQFIETNIVFTGYKVACIECKPDQINLSEYADSDELQTMGLEIKIKGFVASNPDNFKMKFVGTSELIQNDDNEMIDDERTMFIIDYVYESQSSRDIKANELKLKQEYNEKRAQIVENQEKELSELRETRKSQDEEREKWQNKMEKEKKKKKKAADIEAFEAQVEKANDEWNETLKRREVEERQIKRKYKKETVVIDNEESNIPKQRGEDNGDGYVKCNVDISKLKEWNQANNIKLKITANGLLYSDLCSIQTIHPIIKCLCPSLGLFSDSTKINVFLNGFDLQCVDKNNLKIFVEDTKDKLIEIEEFEINHDFISLKLEKFTKFDEKQISIKYNELFEIKAMFLAHDVVKIVSIEPNAFTINESGNMKIKIDTKYEISSKYLDKCEIKINANDKQVLLQGTLSGDAIHAKYIEAKFDDKCFEDIGAAKKAQIEMSFNNQQWIKSKPTISIK